MAVETPEFLTAIVVPVIVARPEVIVPAILTFLTFNEFDPISKTSLVEG